MNEKKIRDKGILIGCTRVDRNFMKESWLWGINKVHVTIYDPSLYGIKDVLLDINPRKKKKIKKVTKTFKSMRKKYDSLRIRGEERREKKGLKTTKRINSFIKKRIKKRKNKKDMLKFSVFLESLSKTLGVKYKEGKKAGIKTYSFKTSLYTVRFSMVRGNLHLRFIKVTKKNDKIALKLIRYIVKATEGTEYDEINIEGNTNLKFWKKMKKKYSVIKY